MEQYISKSALLAEIERLVNNYDKALDYEAALEDVRYFIDTLEVKEVDLEKEVDDWYNTEASEEFEYVLYKDIERCAEHFFKLGMAVSNKA